MTLSRRSFIQTVTVAAGLPFTAPNILTAKSPNEKLNGAAIAVGGRGWSDVNGASHNLVAFCDVMTKTSSRKGGFVEAAMQWPMARRYQDWRLFADTKLPFRFKNLTIFELTGQERVGRLSEK